MRPKRYVFSRLEFDPKKENWKCRLEILDEFEETISNFLKFQMLNKVTSCSKLKKSNVWVVRLSALWAGNSADSSHSANESVLELCEAIDNYLDNVPEQYDEDEVDGKEDDKLSAFSSFVDSLSFHSDDDESDEDDDVSSNSGKRPLPI